MSWVIIATHWDGPEYFLCRDLRWKMPERAHNKLTAATKAEAEFVLSNITGLRRDIYTIEVKEIP